jgi:hypothetical protein
MKFFSHYAIYNGFECSKIVENALNMQLKIKHDSGVHLQDQNKRFDSVTSSLLVKSISA